VRGRRFLIAGFAALVLVGVIGLVGFLWDSGGAKSNTASATVSPASTLPTESPSDTATDTSTSGQPTATNSDTSTVSATSTKTTKSPSATKSKQPASSGAVSSAPGLSAGGAGGRVQPDSCTVQFMVAGLGANREIEVTVRNVGATDLPNWTVVLHMSGDWTRTSNSGASLTWSGGNTISVSANRAMQRSGFAGLAYVANSPSKSTVSPKLLSATLNGRVCQVR
jgi:hypothetical protein